MMRKDGRHARSPYLEQHTGVEGGSMAAGEARDRGTGMCTRSKSLTAPCQGYHQSPQSSVTSSAGASQWSSSEEL